MENEISGTPANPQGPIRRMAIWLDAARPRTLGAAVAPVLIGTAIAFEAGGFHGWSALAALIGALLIQIGTNFANDYFDHVKGADTADRVGPVRATAGGLVTPSAMRWATVLVFALVFIPGAYLIYRGGWPLLAIGLISITCGVLYTGGPYPLAYVGLGDVFALVFFGPVAVGGTYYVQTLEIEWTVILAGLSPGLFSVAILTVNNLRDVETDARAGKRTLAVRFGRELARLQYSAALAGGAVGLPLILALTTGRWALLGCGVILLMALPLIRLVHTGSGTALNVALGGTGRLLVLFSVVFSLMWLL